MKIVIATPLYPPDLGGPAKYAFELAHEFRAQGHIVRTVRFGSLERALPVGLRHVVYFCKLLPRVFGARAIIALDTWSVGMPALCAAKLFKKKLLVRVGGDFLWESYVERTGNLLRFSDFYAAMPPLSTKEKLIRFFTGVLVRHADVVACNGQFQRRVWGHYYRIPSSRVRVVENAFPEQEAASAPEGTVFVAAGRELKLKNMKVLQEVFREVALAHPGLVLDTKPLPPHEHHARLKRAYAVLVPSISEMSPNTLGEAVALQKPFIATEDSGGPERFGDLGLFIDTRDKQAWKAALEKLLDSQCYAEFANRLAGFDHHHTMADIAREYAALLK